MKLLIFFVSMLAAIAINAQPNLQVKVVPEYHVSMVQGQRMLRLSWSVTNSGNQTFVGPNRCTQPGEFTTLFGQPAVAHCWGLTLTSDANGTHYDAVGAAPITWNSGPCEAGIPACAQVVAPGYLTMFNLASIPDGIYVAQFALDPLGNWGGFSITEPFYIRLFGMTAEPIRGPSAP